jgi:hypothetical protein
LSSSRRSTACRLSCTTGTAFSCRAPRAATGKSARISPSTCGRSSPSRCASPWMIKGPNLRPTWCARRSVHAHRGVRGIEPQARGGRQRTYLNPRNTAAGSLRQLDPADGLPSADPAGLSDHPFRGRRSRPPSGNFWNISKRSASRSPTWPAASTISSRRSATPKPGTSAAMSCLRSGRHGDQDRRPELAADLGFVGKDPRGAIAFKFPAREVTTLLQDIKRQRGAHRAC